MPRCNCRGQTHEIMKVKRKLTLDDYKRSAKELAMYLLGKTLVRKIPDNDSEIRAVIVETEAYLGGEDKASHSYNGKRTERNLAMYMQPGTAYVYLVYGMYFCLNISSSDDGAAVLLRAAEPIYGLEQMRHNVYTSSVLKKKPMDENLCAKNHKSACIKEICNGPSKLCRAFKIDKNLNKEDLVKSELLWVEENEEISQDNIFACPRIGLKSSYEEWKDMPLRYYIKDNLFISKKDSKDK